MSNDNFEEFFKRSDISVMCIETTILEFDQFPFTSYSFPPPFIFNTNVASSNTRVGQQLGNFWTTTSDKFNDKKKLSTWSPLRLTHLV